MQSAPADPPLPTLLTFPPENTPSLFTTFTSPLLQKHSACLPRLLSCHPHTVCFDSTVFLLCGVLFLPLHSGCISLAGPVPTHSESQTSAALMGSKPGSGQAAGWLFLVYMCSYCVLPKAVRVCSSLDNAERAALSELLNCLSRYQSMSESSVVFAHTNRMM